MVGAMDLADRHVVVTGAARGIGAALARRFAAGGARVVVADVGDVAAVVAELPAGASASRRRVDRGRATSTLIARAEEAFGPVDLFFANAGIGGGTDLDTPEDVLAAGLRRQRQRPPLGGQAPARRVAGPRRGLLLLDGIGRRAAAADRLGAVHADQAGGGRLRRVARRDVRSAGLRVSCLCPQGVNTEMLRAGDDPASAGAAPRSCARPASCSSRSRWPTSSPTPSPRSGS